MNRRYFGTDGVRGRYGGPVINETFACRLGAAAGRWSKGANSTVLIGRDTRASGESLSRAVAAALVELGWRAQSLGIAPTPAIVRAVRGSGAALGVAVTASHNPADDNGIKFFTGGGRKLTDDEEAAIEALLPPEGQAPASSDRVPLPEVASYVADYIAAAGALLSAGTLTGWRVVLDTANGATCATSPAVFRGLGAEVLGLGDRPNGHNINAGVGSEHPGPLAARVRESGARLGIAHDGDGDRCVLCDERGEVLDGDEIITILATHALAQGRLAARTLVVTVHSNLGVDAAIGAAGGRVVRTPVGDRYVAEAMAAAGATLGGESSGHIILSEISPSGDGLAAALKVAEVMLATGRPLSELRRVLKKFPQAGAALTVREKKPLSELSTLPTAIKKVETDLGRQGRVLVRYSGTESKLRLLVEGPDETRVRAGLATLEAAARSDLDIVGGGKP